MGAKRNGQPRGSAEPYPSGPTDPPINKGQPPATVLVVDDEEAVRASTADILRSQGFDVLEAADGTAATWILASGTVDVLLLDLHLSRLDGTAVLDALEESSTVVVFSAFGFLEETEVRRNFTSSVFECLQKPVPPVRLLEVVTAAAAYAKDKGREPRIRPIAPRMALRLAMAGLARMTPQTERAARARVDQGETLPRSG